MRVLKSLFRIYFAVAIFCVVIPTASGTVYSPMLYTEKPIKKAVGAVAPLKDILFRRYCSSVSVSYMGKNYTLTNRHCCNAYDDIFVNGYRFIGYRIEKILYKSESNDVCVLTSKSKKSIKLAKKPAKMFDTVLVFGYPRGKMLTPRFGHVLSTSSRSCIEYRDGVRCEDGIVSSNLIFPGNSGSPLLNMDGELVGLAYAGNWAISYSISVKLENIRKVLDRASKVK